MANTAQATKRAQQSNERCAHNSAQRSAFRTAIRTFRKDVAAKGKEVSMQNLQQTVSVIDKSVTKGLIHPNKAARLKSRLNKSLKNQAK